MKRIIIDYKKLNPEILTLLTNKFPDGYGDKDVIEFKNLKNDTIEAVEVQTNDTIYLVKVSSKLNDTITNFDLDDDTENPSEAIGNEDDITLKPQEFQEDLD